MSNLKPVPIHEAWIADANELLLEAIESEFESVIVLGYKNGAMHIRKSAAVDFLKLIGALEWAKHRYIDNLSIFDDDE